LTDRDELNAKHSKIQSPRIAEHEQNIHVRDFASQLMHNDHIVDDDLRCLGDQQGREA
jgi:hypothetical protein